MCRRPMIIARACQRRVVFRCTAAASAMVPRLGHCLLALEEEKDRVGYFLVVAEPTRHIAAGPSATYVRRRRTAMPSASVRAGSSVTTFRASTLASSSQRRSLHANHADAGFTSFIARRYA